MTTAAVLDPQKYVSLQLCLHAFWTAKINGFTIWTNNKIHRMLNKRRPSLRDDFPRISVGGFFNLQSGLVASRTLADTCNTAYYADVKRLPSWTSLELCGRVQVEKSGVLQKRERGCYSTYVLLSLSNKTLASAAATRLLPSAVCRPNSVTCSDSARERSAVPASHRLPRLVMSCSVAKSWLACVMSRRAR